MNTQFVKFKDDGVNVINIILPGIDAPSLQADTYKPLAAAMEGVVYVAKYSNTDKWVPKDVASDVLRHIYGDIRDERPGAKIKIFAISIGSLVGMEVKRKYDSMVPIHMDSDAYDETPDNIGDPGILWGITELQLWLLNPCYGNFLKFWLRMGLRAGAWLLWAFAWLFKPWTSRKYWSSFNKNDSVLLAAQHLLYIAYSNSEKDERRNFYPDGVVVAEYDDFMEPLKCVEHFDGETKVDLIPTAHADFDKNVALYIKALQRLGAIPK